MLPPMSPSLLAAWLHDLDPFLIELPGLPGGGVRWYGLAYIAGFVAGWLLIRRVTTRGRTPLPTDRVTDLVTAVAIGLMVGGRLGYCLFYEPSLLITWDAEAFPWWGALALNRGGMASHGGMIGAVLGVAWFAWRRRLPLLHAVDLIAFAAPAGLLFGRLANFINGELWGRVASASFPLAVRFPQELRVAGIARDAANGDAAAAELYALMFEDPAARSPAALVQDGAPAAIAYAAQALPARHPSQLYAALLEGALVLTVGLWVYRRPVKPGTLAAVFGLTYAAARIAGEFFREPDEGIDLVLGLSRGQYLSLALAAAALTLLVITRRRNSIPLGGWISSDDRDQAAAAR